MRKRRYPSIFDAFENLTRGFPFKELVREEETPAGTSRRYGPFVYGFSYTAEPGKEPTFWKLGKIRPGRSGIEPSAGRETLVDGLVI